MFTVEAELIEGARDHVRLRRSDGKTVTVPIDRLSQADRQYLRTLDAPKGGDMDTAARLPRANALAARHALTEPITLQFIGTPLECIADYISDCTVGCCLPILVEIDQPALSKDGRDGGITIDVDVVRQPLAECLDQALKPVGLTWIIHNDMLWITTPAAANEILQTRFYRSLKSVPGDGIVRSITQAIAPSRWADAGGAASIAVVSLSESNHGLVIRAPFQAHRRIEDRCKELIVPVRGSPLALPETVVSSSMAERLALPATVQVIGTPLKDVVADLGNRVGMAITISTGNSAEDSRYGEMPITRCLGGVSLELMLSLMLHGTPLGWKVENDHVILCKVEQVSGSLVLGEYKVDSLKCQGGLDAIGACIRRTVEPATWDSVGGPASLHAKARGTLTVRATHTVHRKIAALLGDMLEAAKEQNESGPESRAR